MALFILHQKKENFATDSATFCKEIGHRIKTTTFFNFKSLVCSYCEDFYYYASSYFNVRKTDLNRLTDLSRQTKSFNHCWQKWKQGFLVVWITLSSRLYMMILILQDWTEDDVKWQEKPACACFFLFPEAALMISIKNRRHVPQAVIKSGSVTPRRWIARHLVLDIFSNELWYCSIPFPKLVIIKIKLR